MLRVPLVVCKDLPGGTRETHSIYLVVAFFYAFLMKILLQTTLRHLTSCKVEVTKRN